jgi:hypothetical protein
VTGAGASLLDLDPDLADGLDPAELAAARRILVPVATAAVGSWRPPIQVAAGAGALGFLVVEGLLTRGAMVADTRCTELLGRGDILRPWSMDATEVSSVPIEADWHVVDQPARLAVLDANVTRQLGRWPTITCEILDRAITRARWLTLQLAVCHTKHVETRLLMILWHFADRWGRVRADGVVIDLQLSHRTLGEIVGARRQTVTTALGRLRETGKLKPVDDGHWLLLGDPPAVFEEGAHRLD